MINAKTIVGFVICMSILFSHIASAPAALSTNTWQVTKTQIFETKANSEETLSENVLRIVEDEEDVPEECRKRRFGTTCAQETNIKVEVTTTWTITEAQPIDSKLLLGEEFAKSYPAIQEQEEITNSSSEEDKLVTQRILYERGMLSVPPTGFIGHLTLMGITHLQQLKNIYSEPNKIGPRTIEELNALKERMETPEYLEENPLPEPDPYTFAPVLRDVYVDHSKKIELIENHPGFYKAAEIITPFDESPVPFINYFGEIKITPQEETE